MPHLPVAILPGPLEGSIDGGALEGRQGDDRPAADGRLIGLGGEDGGKPSIVADGTVVVLCW